MKKLFLYISLLSIGSMAVIGPFPGAESTSSSSRSGTVTSVGLDATPSSIFDVSNSPITDSGNIGLSLDNQSANTFLSGPSSGSSATPAFRSLVAADLPSGTGTVTSVGMSVPSFLSVSGSPVTTSGTLAVSLANQSVNTVFAGPSSGSSTTPTFRSLVSSDIPNLDTSKITTGILPVVRGGTGINQLLGGEMLYGNADYSGNISILGGNISTSKKFLTETGYFAGANAPMWSLIEASDIPPLSYLTSSLSSLSDSNPSFTDKIVNYSTNSAANAGTTLKRIGGIIDPALNGGRLTLTSGTPVTTSDVNNAGTVYFTPFNGDRITIFDGTRDVEYEFSEISIAVPSTIFRVFDVFIYDNSGTLTLETVNWNQTTGTITGATAANPCVITSNGHGLSNGDLVGIAGIVGTLGTNAALGVNGRTWTVTATAANTFTLANSNTTGLTYTSGGTWYKIPNTRATALTTSEGVLYKNGDTTRRYLGSGMTNGTSANMDDSLLRRTLSNYYNRVERPLLFKFAASNWTYTTDTWRAANQANIATDAKVEYLAGYTDTYAQVTGRHYGATSSATAVGLESALGLDTPLSENSNSLFSRIGSMGGAASLMMSFYNSAPALGYHYQVLIERSDAAATSTWFGAEANKSQGGITGYINN